jgi:hypothetical protein
MPALVTIASQHRRPRDARCRKLRRLAIQLAAQLPDDEGEAMETLELTKTLVRSFLADPGAV